MQGYHYLSLDEEFKNKGNVVKLLQVLRALLNTVQMAGGTGLKLLILNMLMKTMSAMKLV